MQSSVNISIDPWDFNRVLILGGTLGLFTGASIISMFEVVYWIALHILSRLDRKWNHQSTANWTQNRSKKDSQNRKLESLADSRFNSNFWIELSKMQLFFIYVQYISFFNDLSNNFLISLDFCLCIRAEVRLAVKGVVLYKRKICFAVEWYTRLELNWKSGQM